MKLLSKNGQRLDWKYVHRVYERRQRKAENSVIDKETTTEIHQRWRKYNKPLGQGPVLLYFFRAYQKCAHTTGISGSPSSAFIKYAAFNAPHLFGLLGACIFNGIPLLSRFYDLLFCCDSIEKLPQLDLDWEQKVAKKWLQIKARLSQKCTGKCISHIT